MNDTISEIIRREGGYVWHGADRGGPTNHGITQATLSDYRGRPATVDDVRGLTEEEARAIYADLYISRPGFDQIADDRLREAVVDYGVNSGTATAARALQRAAGVAVDGAVGPRTLEAVNSGDAAAIRRRVIAERLRHIGRIITNNPTQAVFAAGWANRIAEFIEGDAA